MIDGQKRYVESYAITNKLFNSFNYFIFYLLCAASFHMRFQVQSSLIIPKTKCHLNG